MADLDLTVAMCHYEHAADLLTGRIAAEGIGLRWLDLPVEEIFQRFLPHREWEISEMSMGKYTALVAAGDDSLVGLPVFPSRVFRHSGIYVRADAASEPDDLAAARVGVPEWAQTAGVYMRALLTHEYGLALEKIDWYQAGVNQAGREERVALRLPPGVRLTPVPDRSLDEMLLAGDLDAVLSAHPPDAFRRGDPRVRRLFADPVAVEEDYGRRTGIVPIMHLLVVRRDVVDAYPWVPGNLMAAFERARARSVERLRAGSAGPGSRVPVLWTDEVLRRTESVFGGEPWPYGVAATCNVTTLEAFTTWACEQGVARRKVGLDELFDVAVRSRHRV